MRKGYDVGIFKKREYMKMIFHNSKTRILRNNKDVNFNKMVLLINRVRMLQN